MWLPFRGGTIDYNLPAFADDFTRIWRAIATAPFEILVVSGDVHHSRLMTIRLNGGARIHECVVSPANRVYGGGMSSLDLPGPKQVKPAVKQPLQPKGIDFVFATRVTEVIGAVKLIPALGNEVSVSVALEDLRRSRPPVAKSATFGGFEYVSKPGGYVAEQVFTLRQRTAM